MKTNTVGRSTAPASWMVAAAMALAATGCSTSAANITCDEFMGLPQAGQDEVVVAWREAKHIGTVAGTERLVIPQDREALIAYCSQPGHATDKLTDLEYSWG